jgi:hypothetical protein
MTKDDIIRMTKEANGYFAELPNVDAWIFEEEKYLERFADLVAAAEREAIEQRVLKSDMTMANRLYVVNDLIRARGQS